MLRIVALFFIASVVSANVQSAKHQGFLGQHPIATELKQTQLYEKASELDQIQVRDKKTEASPSSPIDDSGDFASPQSATSMHAAINAINLDASHLGDPSHPGEYWFKLKFPVPEIYKQDPWFGGPTQIDDLGLLYATIKETRPATLVQIGIFDGDGSKLLLSACDDDAKLYDFDPYKPETGNMIMSLRPNQYKYLHKPAQEMTLADLDGRLADFAFFDAGHKFEENKEMWKALVKVLSQDAIVAIHDTGCWSKPFLDAHQADTVKYNFDVSQIPVTTHDGKQWLCHQNSVDERLFVNWIRQEYPQFATVNFHTYRYVRNGMTLLQKQQDLWVP